MASKSILKKFINLGPLILLYYLSISEIDSHFESYFEILSFNIQLIIIYFWVSKRPEVLGRTHFSWFIERCRYGISSRRKFFILFSGITCSYLYKKYDSKHKDND